MIHVVPFNLRGLIGLTVSGVAGWSAFETLREFGFGAGFLSPIPCVMLLISFACCIFGLTTDRCELPGLFASYAANWSQFFLEHFGLTHDGRCTFHSGRRVAMFGLPLAAYPLLLLILSMCYWLFDSLDANPMASHPQHAAYWGLTLQSVVLGWLYAKATRWLRLIPSQGSDPIFRFSPDDGSPDANYGFPLENRKAGRDPRCAAVAATVTARGRWSRLASFRAQR